MNHRELAAYDAVVLQRDDNDRKRVEALEQVGMLKHLLAESRKSEKVLREAFTAHCVQCPQCEASWRAALAAEVPK